MDSEQSVVIITNSISIILALVYLVAIWKVLVKAGKPGWGAIVPIYNSYLFLKIAGKPGWWLILYFIPFVNIYAAFSTVIGIAKAFNRSTLFGIVMLGLFGPIGFMILAFGKSTYVGIQSGSSPANPSQTSNTPNPPLISPEDLTRRV